MSVSLELLGEATAEVRGAVEIGLTEHAVAAGAPTRDVRALSVIARDSSSKMVGALLGRTVWGWLHVKELWVDESHRHKGIGRKLMAAAEQVAIERGCHGSYLDTFDFQSVPFYRQLGYSTMGTLEDFPLGHTRFFLHKRLKSLAPPNNSLERSRDP